MYKVYMEFFGNRLDSCKVVTYNYIYQRTEIGPKDFRAAKNRGNHNEIW